MIRHHAWLYIHLTHLDTPLCRWNFTSVSQEFGDWLNFQLSHSCPCALSSEPRFPWCWHKTLYVPRLCRKDLFRIQLWIITVRETEFSQGPACEDPLETERPSWFIHDSQENPSWIDSQSHDWAVELSCCELQTGFDLIRQMCSSFKDERAETCRLKPWQQLWRVSYILQVISGYSEWKNAIQMKLWLPTIPNRMVLWDDMSMKYMINRYVSYGRNYLFRKMPSPNLGGPVLVLPFSNIDMGVSLLGGPYRLWRLSEPLQSSKQLLTILFIHQLCWLLIDSTHFILVCSENSKQMSRTVSERPSKSLAKQSHASPGAKHAADDHLEAKRTEDPYLDKRIQNPESSLKSLRFW